MTPHFFVATVQVGADEALLDDQDTRHLVTVLRARPGSSVTVADNSGTIWTGTYAGMSGGAAAISLLQASVVLRPRPSLTVIHALPKQRKLDAVVSDLTELGVDRIVPASSERSQVELDDRRAAKAVARWRAVALAAAKQSRRAWVPEIAGVTTWARAFPPGVPGVVAWEESTTGLRAALDGIVDPPEFVLGIGPEGGLSPDEISLTGLPDVSLGPDILRTETAALVAAAAVRFAFGLMEPR